MISLLKIDRSCESNLAGIYAVYAQSASVLTETPAHRLGILITQAIPEGFIEYEFDAKTAIYNEKTNLLDAGVNIEQSLTFQVSKETTEKRAATNRLIHTFDPVLIFKDKNGLFRIMGSKKHPCTPQYGQSTGARAGDKNYIEFSFTANVSVELLSYTGVLPTPAEIE